MEASTPTAQLSLADAVTDCFRFDVQDLLDNDPWDSLHILQFPVALCIGCTALVRTRTYMYYPRVLFYSCV